MIQEIANCSGGATIKILADKKDYRSNEDTIITVGGSTSSMIEATCRVIEQIECFKNGGPVIFLFTNPNNHSGLNQRKVFIPQYRSTIQKLCSNKGPNSTNRLRA